MRGVHKAYGSKQVLVDLDLDLAASEVFALLGPNGAGKTTAIEILEGYRRADRGSVEVLGHDPGRGRSDLRARVGIVPQQTSAFEHSTVAETVSMFATLFPDPLSVVEAVDLVGLGEEADRLATELSGGQRRRLDVACGLVGRPEVLFLDEPTTGLDPEARHRMWRVVHELGDRGVTVVLTTHYLDEAEALADRIGVLLEGRLVAEGPPDRIGWDRRRRAQVRFQPPPGAVVPEGRDGDGDWVSVDTEHPDAVVAEAMVRYGALVDLTVTRPSLEEVYLELVSESGALR